MVAQYSAYDSKLRMVAPVRSARSIEYELLARTTQRLQESWARRESAFGDLARAVADNTILWASLGADLVEPGNGLPPELKARLFYLYQFSEQHGQKVLAGLGDAGVLVEINMAVMRGLRGETGVSS